MTPLKNTVLNGSQFLYLWLPGSLIHFTIFSLVTMTAFDVKNCVPYPSNQFIRFGFQVGLADKIRN